MENELKLLEELIMEEEKKLEFNQKVMCMNQKDESKKKLESLFKIAKIVNAESHSLKNNKKNIAAISERILNESASIYVQKDADEEITLRIYDNVYKRDIAEIVLKKFFDLLIIQEYNFY